MYRHCIICFVSLPTRFNITGLPEKQEWTMMTRHDAEEKPVSGEVGTVLFLRGWGWGTNSSYHS